MKHQRLASSESISTFFDSLARARSKKWKLAIAGSVAIILLLVAGVSVGILVRSRNGGSGSSEDSFLKPTQAISRTCGHTRNEDLCIQTLLSFPGSQFANERKLVDIAVNASLLHVGNAIASVSEINNIVVENLVRSAYEDCLELLQDSADQLSRSLQLSVAGGSSTDVMTWLSAALTNHDTCSEGLSETRMEFKTAMENRLKNVAELISNSLAIYSVYGVGIGEGDLTGIPIHNRRRKLLQNPVSVTNEDDFPAWVSRRERKLLQVPVTQIHADYVVAQDGSGNFKTITEAIKAVPEHSSRRIVIYVKTGRYEENILKVGRKKTNLMFIGDGKGKTVITGGKNIFDKITTFRTATFAATGAGFMARDMTFENYAGPDKHQAVALRVGADHSVIYRCNIIGYQDTLYVHSQRQFYRECDIYGTVDFIFGNAAVVFQKCNIFARKPLPNQKNTITAQNRKDPNQNTGISIHDCRLVPTGDLVPVKGSIRTYLGRPWKLYSRVVYMLTYMGDHIDQGGWLEWNGNFALDTLYYGEYMNYGPGAAIGKRVTWKGYRVITAEAEAAKFTVAQFIYGSSWLPSTGVAFAAGLTR